MTQQNGTAPQVEIRREDIQGVLAEHALFAALVENRALKRTLKENSDARISKDVPANVGKDNIGSVRGSVSKS